MKHTYPANFFPGETGARLRADRQKTLVNIRYVVQIERESLEGDADAEVFLRLADSTFAYCKLGDLRRALGVHK